MTRPTLEDVLAFRKHVTEAVLSNYNQLPKEAIEVLDLGINHEQQHQELLYTDIKYLLYQHPIYPVYNSNNILEENIELQEKGDFVKIEEGLYNIGYEGEDFHFDNEGGVHKVFINEFQISKSLVTNGEYLDFIENGGYKTFKYWLSEAWGWIAEKNIQAPMYWVKQEGQWFQITLAGLQPLNLEAPVSHLSYYEADAFADFSGKRLATEFEWEVASQKFDWGKRWELTKSAYLAYPQFKKQPGAIGEYNGKFMVNQMVLRGASIATPKGNSRNTYRNFFHPHLQWQFSGLRLVK